MSVFPQPFTSILLILSLLGLADHCRRRAEEPIEDKHVGTYNGVEFYYYIADPCSIKMAYKDPKGQSIGSIGNLRNMVEDGGGTLHFAMNGGMYTQSSKH